MLPYILPPKQYDFVHSWKHRSRRDNELDQRKPGSKNFSAAKEIKRQFPEETVQEIIPESIMRMPVTRPKGVLGIKGNMEKRPTEGRELLRYKQSLNLLFQLLLGNTSANYLRLYDQGIIDDTFGFEVSLDRSFTLLIFLEMQNTLKRCFKRLKKFY